MFLSENLTACPAHETVGAMLSQGGLAERSVFDIFLFVMQYCTGAWPCPVLHSATLCSVMSTQYYVGLFLGN